MLLVLLLACGTSGSEARDGEPGAGGSAGTSGSGGTSAGAAGTSEIGSLGTPGCNDPGPAVMPEVLTQGQTFNSYVIEPLGSKLVVATEAALFVMPIEGGTLEPIAEGAFDVGSLAVDGSSIFFGSLTGDLLEIALEGGTPRTVATGVGSAREIDANNVYTLSPTIFAASRGTGTAVALGTAETWADLAIDSEYVYFVDFPYANVEPDSLEGILNRAPLGGGELTTLARLPDFFPQAIALDSNFAYVGTTGMPSTVFRIPLEGGEAVPFAYGGGGGRARMLTDAGNLYFLDRESSTFVACIKRKPLAGGEPIVVAKWSGFGYGLTQDATFLYFTDGAKVMRALK